MVKSGRQLVVVAVFLSVAWCLTGCHNMVFVASPGARVTTKHVEGGKIFRVETQQSFGLWGAVPHHKLIYVDRAVSRYLGRTVDNISDLRIRIGHNFASGLVGAITLGLIHPKAVIFEGKYH